MPIVESLEKMPELKAEKLIREHQAMRTTLLAIRAIAKNYSGYNDFKNIISMVDQTINT
jgi:hypothetical protein